MLYALLADKLPFAQEHPSERMFAILTKEFEALSADVPQNVQRIIAKSLAKQPENRYQTTTEMRDELQKALLGIAHPTFAPTEVFRISPENLPPIPTIENRYETNAAEKETVISQPPVNFSAPTQAAFHPESFVTNVKETQPNRNQPAFSTSSKANQPPPTQFQISGNQLPNRLPIFVGSVSNLLEKNRESKYLIAIAVGVFAVVAILFIINFGRKSSIVSNPSNSSTVSSSNTSTSSAFPLSIELKTKRDFGLRILVDNKDESDIKSSAVEKKFTAYKSFEIAYLEVFYDDIKLKINGKDITLPKDSSDGSSTVRFIITKDNYNRVLQPGTNSGQLIVNTNAAANSVSTSAANSSSNSVSTAEMSVELKNLSSAELITSSEIDGKTQYFSLESGEVKKFISQQSFQFRCFKKGAEEF